MIRVKWNSSADSDAAVSSGREQLDRASDAGQIEAAFEQPRDDSALRLVEMVVAVRRFDQQSGQSELQRLLPPGRSLPADPANCR